MRRIGRRVFVQRSALAFLAMGLPPEILVRPLGAARRRAGKKILVCLFQRGAVDGLNMIVPFGEDAYYRDRRGIAIPPPRRGGDAQEFALDLDGFFGLHPSLAPRDRCMQMESSRSCTLPALLTRPGRTSRPRTTWRRLPLGGS